METLNSVMRMYTILSLLYQHHRLILMGDSAGGGLALALRQMLNNSSANNPAGKNKHHALPDRMVLYSPWLNISLSNLDNHNRHTRREALPPLSDLQKSGKRYAGGYVCTIHAARPYMDRLKSWGRYRFSSPRMSCFIQIAYAFMKKRYRPKAQK